MLALIALNTALASAPALTAPSLDPLTERITLNTATPLTVTAADALVVQTDSSGDLHVLSGHTSLTPWQLARATGDDASLRRAALRTTGAALGVGALGVVSVGSTLVGTVGLIGGMFTVAAGGTSGDGLAMLGMAAGGFAVGTLSYYGAAALGALFFHRIRDYSTWYTTAEVQERVDAYNRDPSLHHSPKRTVTVRPAVSLNGLGILGTF